MRAVSLKAAPYLDTTSTVLRMQGSNCGRKYRERIWCLLPTASLFSNMGEAIWQKLCPYKKGISICMICDNRNMGSENNLCEIVKFLIQ